ncbi:MAG TPA: hypothetical protein DEG55_03925 [Acidaminococcaceae bacterium]|nr:hypothetical protein [Acidaminococcaceae bacterium]
MNMKKWKDRYNPILIFCIAVAFCAALWLVQTRIQIEKRNDTVEQTLDYQAILMMAQREGCSSEKLLQQFKDAGVTTLIVYDTTLERLDREGRISAMPGDVLQKAAKGIHHGDFDVVLSSVQINPDAVYVTHGKDEEAWTEVKEDLLLRYGAERLRTVSQTPEILEIKGDSRLLLEPDYRAKTPMMQAPLGLSVKELKEVEAAGFLTAIRPQNYLPYSRKATDSLFSRIDKSGVQVTTYIPCGTDVIGFPNDIGYMGKKLEERNIRLGLLEHVTQLQFARFDGLDALLRSVDNNAVRVLNIDAQENSKLMMPDALRRWALADEERNIRVNYVRLFLKPQNAVDIIDLNLDYMKQITQQVKARGYKIGVAGVFQKPGEKAAASANGTPGFAGSYEPGRWSLLLVALGAWAALALYLGMILPSLKGWKQYALVGAGMLVTAFCLFMGRGLSLRQGLAFLSAVLYPVLSMSVILTLWENSKTDIKSTGGVIITALWQLALAIVLSLVGATLNAAIMGDTRFFLEADIYRGVKLTFIMPVLLMLLLFLRQYSIFSQDGARPAELFSQLVKICKTRLTLGHFVILGVLLFVAYIFVGRSGHTGGVPVPAIEIKLRLFLEEIMYARPREKEFMIGHPAFFLAVLAAYRMAPNWCKLALVVGAVIGQGSLVQTFCHMRTPAIMSYIRAADGYLLGSVLGIIAVIAVSILMPYVKPWLRRFSVNE